MIDVGKNNKATAVEAMYVGVNGKAKKVLNGYIGVDNKAQLVYTQNQSVFQITYSNSTDFEISARNLFIDFGDGTTYKYGNVSRQKIQHSYSDAQPHSIKISGVMSAITFRGDYNLLSVDTVFPKFGEITNFSSCFNDCSNLASIPSGLFDNCTQVTDFTSCFDGCSNLASIPSGLFDNCTQVKNFTGCFRGCSSIISDVPDLWNTGKWSQVTQHFQCFNRCTNAQNYADIPSNWK